MSKRSSWQCSYPGAADKIICFDNTRAYTYNKIRGKIRKLAADHFGCSFKDLDLKVRLSKPQEKQKSISSAIQRSLGTQKTLDIFGVV